MVMFDELFEVFEVIVDGGDVDVLLICEFLVR